ncbi:PREDICTED: LOC109947232 [Prunus dulcis]|uniref:PREDICTED: LOC109947232 n=1 Tax=Prunus dulcis TaxID=3755 RepID=A0A5E4EX74_PRUDU|nr:PREDICTED: LOC109947232 [Prunus dulcis]
MEEAQLEEHVYEQVDDEGTETDDGEGADEEDDIKDPDLSDYREYSPTLVCIWSSSSEDEAIANLRRRRRKRMPKGENFRPEIDRRRNPGTTIVIKSELEGDRPGFERLYICLAACKKGFLDEIESVNSWVWFLELLVADLEIANSNGYVFISDK